MKNIARKQRVLAIGLDGYEESVERQLIAAGELPAMARLREKSARFLLDHGASQRIGLTWEHFATGLSPERASRWAAVHFDPATYEVWQEGTRLAPFAAQLKSRVVVYDTPYFDLNYAPQVFGLVNWGAHDPGIPLTERPEGLLSECESRFGRYPAADWIYGLVWHSAELTKEMGKALVQACDTRACVARWLFGERLPDWDLAIVVASEPHSAIEGFWHGIDKTHPLHSLPSAGPARDGLIAVYRAVDRLVGELVTNFPDAAVMVFSMGGMGPNRSDVPSMVLLPELMYRYAFGRSFYRQPRAWTGDSPDGMLDAQGTWADAVNTNFPTPFPERMRRFPGTVRKTLRRLIRQPEPEESYLHLSINWNPATRYRQYWRSMRAFALPSFYDGRIRINLAGREQKGLVPVSQYTQLCEEIEAMLRACRDPLTGEGVVDHIERRTGCDPRTLNSSESDIVVVWKGTGCAFEHPTLGRVGPVPFRRPGGHTGNFGMAYIANSGLQAGDRGVRSSFDVVPTLIDLIGEDPLPGLSGTSLLPALTDFVAEHIGQRTTSTTS